jgi:arylsulfatase A-like enzyme/Tfp pilus assembly protein PilF
VVLAALSAAACSSRERPRIVRPASIVLVSIDTLRADRLPIYGYAQGATPHLDRVAREGVVFENAYSHCPLTLPSHASLLTGLLPPRHGVRDNAGYALPPGSRTLAVRLHEAGFATGAAVSAFVMRRSTGLAQGFSRYDDAIETDAALEDVGEQQRDGARAVESLLGWISGLGGQRFFAFLHLYEPHAPYAPPSPYKERIADPYDGEVAYADALVGRLLEGLKARGLDESTFLAIVSDHGEALGDHGEREHGFFLYRETVRVPVLLRVPGRARAGRRLATPVGLVDLTATLLDLGGAASDGLDGRSLRAGIEGGALAERPVYSETWLPRLHFGWSELTAASEQRFRHVRAPRPELYDLANDPRETRNLAAERPQAVAATAAWLQAQSAGAARAPAEVDAATRERLAALGYVSGGTLGAAPAGGLADPKDKVAVYERYRQALASRRRGADADTVRELRTVLADEPLMRDAWETLGLTLGRMGRQQEAADALDRAVRLDPGRPSAHLALARLQALGGHTEQAISHARIAAARQPGEGNELLAQLLLARGRFDEAAAAARHSLEADPSRAGSRFVLATVARRAGQCEAALEEYRGAIEAQRLQRRLVIPGLHAGRGDCLARLGREAEAEQAFRDELAQLPASREARVGLAMLYRSQGRDGEARRALEGVVGANPRAGADDYWVVARTFTVLGDDVAARRWSGLGRQRFPGDPRFR